MDIAGQTWSHFTEEGLSIGIKTAHPYWLLQIPLMGTVLKSSSFLAEPLIANMGWLSNFAAGGKPNNVVLKRRKTH